MSWAAASDEEDPVGAPRRSGGRPRPDVRRPASLLPALESGAPFLFLGGGCLAVAVWSYIANPAPGDPIPLWTLLAAVGVIAIAGGLLGAIVPEREEAPSLPSRAQRPAYRRLPVGLEPRTVRPGAPFRPPASAAPPPAPGGGALLFDSEGSDFLGARADEPERTTPARPRAPPVERPSTPVFSRPEPRARPLAAPGPDPAVAVFPASTEHRRTAAPALASPIANGSVEDEVLQSLNELSSLLASGSYRSVPDRSGAAAQEEVPELAICSGCEGALGPSAASTRCASCRGPLCDQCADPGSRDDHPVRCPTCEIIGAEPSDMTPSSGIHAPNP